MEKNHKPEQQKLNRWEKITNQNNFQKWTNGKNVQMPE